MKKLFILNILILLCFLTGCYDDKGNYDYSDIDEISVSFPHNVGDDKNIILVGQLGEPLSIQPQVKYGAPQDLRYTWERYTQNGKETKVLSHARDLDIARLSYDDGQNSETVNKDTLWQVGRYDMKYTVTDTVTKQSIEKLFTLSIRSITPLGVYVMYGDEKSSDIATIENSDFTIGLQTADKKIGYYSSKFGKKMDGKGIAIHWYAVDNGGWFKGLCAFTDKGGQDINTTAFTENVDFRKMFIYWWIPKYAPKVSSVTNFTTGERGCLLYVKDDKNKDVAWFGSLDSFHGDDDKSRFAFYMSEPVSSSLISGAVSPDVPGSSDLAFDTSKHMFVQPYGELPLDPDENPSAFDPSNLGDGTLIGIDFGQYNSDAWAWNNWAIYKTADDKLMAYRFNCNPDEGKSRFDVAQVIANADMNPDLLDINSFSMSTLIDGIGYLSTPDAVYSMDIINSPADAARIFQPDAGETITSVRLLKTGIADDDIKNLNSQFYSNVGKALYVVTRKGDQGFIYRVPVTNEGSIDNLQSVQKYDGFGIIRSITFRLE